VSRQLEIEPARVYVREDRSYSYSCRSCRAASPVVASRKPPSALSKGIFGPSVAALVTELKFARHLPLYRQQEILVDHFSGARVLKKASKGMELSAESGQ
jgi:transposase